MWCGRFFGEGNQTISQILTFRKVGISVLYVLDRSKKAKPDSLPSDNNARGNPDREQMVLRIESQDGFAYALQKAAPRLEGIRRNSARTQDKLGQGRLERFFNVRSPSQLANRIEIVC